ncbi:hypothetical protein Tco_0208774, partial [Tanacetum coccineum]
KEHEGHLRLILKLLKDEKLYAKFSKCKFWLSKVQFLGHVIDSEGIHVDPAKIEYIKDWASPNTLVMDIQEKDKNRSQNDKNRARERKERERKVKSRPKVNKKSKSNQVKVNPRMRH